MATETKRIDDASIPLATDLQGVTIPVMQGGVSKRLMAEQLTMSGTAYGIRIDNAVSNSAVTRIGNPVLHQSLPVQSLMRRCVLNIDGTVKYFLDANNSTLKENGTAAILSGADGDVMVEIPQFYYRVDVVSGTASELWISLSELPGFIKSPKMYISAYEATVNRSNNQLASVASASATYRGGSNNAAWDAETRTSLGRPATSISRINFTTYARNKGAYGLNGTGWNQFTYDAWKAMCMLYYVEYANRNSQLAFNAATDANGFKQGGLGEGVTTLNGTKWSTWNSYNPFIPCGHTNALGNKTGELSFSMPVEYDPVATNVMVPSYRGIENPFGHIWKWIEGINIRTQAADAGGRSTAFVTSNPTLFNHINYTGFREVGDHFRANSYIKEMMLGPYFDIIGKTSGAGTTTYWCDYGEFGYPPSTGEALRALFVGGAADTGAAAGLVTSSTHYVPSSASAYIGARLCFHP